MNRCWVINAKGEGAARDIQPADDRELRLNGYRVWRIARFDDAAQVGSALIYVHPGADPGNKEMFAANTGLWGEGGEVKLWKPDGEQVWP